MNMNSYIAQNRVIAREMRLNSSRDGLFDILIRADGVELSEPFRNSVMRKIGRVRQYAPRAFRARVQIHRERLKPSASQYRVTVHYELPGNDVIARHRAHDPLAALDAVSEKIERRLRKRKTARLARRIPGKGGKAFAFPPPNHLTTQNRGDYVQK
jgi:ribosomal subunit interface protein